MLEVVIVCTSDAEHTEIETVYGQLQGMLNEKIQPAPDEWDRLFNVDFFIKIKDRYIGLQIKPVAETAQIAEIFKERAIQAATYVNFKRDFGGNVFYVFSAKEGKTKRIVNSEVVDQIRCEIERLKGE